jgi:hypothetical protein
MHPTNTISIHHELEKVKFPEFFGARMTQPLRHGGRIWKYSLCFTNILPTRRSAWWYSIEGEHSSIVEESPATFEHGRQRRVMGNIRGTVLREVYFEEFIECQLNEFNAL